MVATAPGAHVRYGGTVGFLHSSGDVHYDAFVPDRDSNSATFPRITLAGRLRSDTRDRRDYEGIAVGQRSHFFSEQRSAANHSSLRASGVSSGKIGLIRSMTVRRSSFA